jgi:hypothetical protein
MRKARSRIVPAKLQGRELFILLRATGAVALGMLIAERPMGARRYSPAVRSHRTSYTDLPDHALQQSVHSTASASGKTGADGLQQGCPFLI